MNVKYLLFILSALLVSLSLVFLFADNTPLSLTATSYIHSYKKTSDTEYFHVQVLSNKKESIFFIEEEVISSSLTDNKEVIPLELKEINITETNNGSYIVDYSFKVGFHSEDYRISFTKAYLHLTFTDEEMTIFIGEFNYLFNEEVSTDISLMNLEATYQELEGIETVSGLLITLRNNTYNNIVITDIEILSSSVDVMNEEVFVLNQDIDNFTPVEEILDKEYDFYNYEQSAISITIHRDEEVTLFGPLLFNGDIKYIHRFSVMITYLIGNQEHTYYIDDFPFMRENLFFNEYEEYQHVYTFPTN